MKEALLICSAQKGKYLLGKCRLWGKKKIPATHPVHDEDLADVEPLLQELRRHRHRVEVAESPDGENRGGKASQSG